MAGSDMRDAAARIFDLLGDEERRKRRLAGMMDRLRQSGWVEPRPGRRAQGATVADAADAIETRLSADGALRTEAERQVAGQTGPGIEVGETGWIGADEIDALAEDGGADILAAAQDAYPIPPQKPEAPMSPAPPIPPVRPAFDPLAGWPEMQSPLASAVIRAEAKPDGQFGYGTFGASRAGGARPPHKGIDLATAAGTPVYAPVKGTIAVIGQPYKKDNKGLGAIHIRGDDGHLMKIFYVAPIQSLKAGQTVEPGTLLGISQSLQEKHPPLDDGSKMTDHVHFEFYDPKGRLVDPTPSVDKWRKEADNWWRMGGRKDVFDRE